MSSENPLTLKLLEVGLRRKTLDEPEEENPQMARMNATSENTF